MHCPFCHDALIAEASCGQTVDRCRSCGGLWLDASELGSLVRQTPSQANTDPARRRCINRLHCPGCRHTLKPFNYAHDSGVYINRCDRCDGIWLERGQLELLVQYRSGTTATRALADAWAGELRGRSRVRFARQLFRSRVLSGTVAAVQVIGQFVATGDLYLTLSLLVTLLFPLLCIWFADALGNLKGVAFFGPGHPRINRTTPGDFVAIGGWVLLLARLVVSLMLGV